MNFTLWQPLVLGLALAVMGADLLWGTVYFARSDVLSHIYDQGVTLGAAVRILEGQVPYKDFGLIYAPGQAYSVAALFRLFGPSVSVAHGWDFVARGLLALAVYWLARQATAPRVALVPFGLAVLWLATGGIYMYPLFPGMALSLLSAGALLKFQASQARFWPLIAGALAAGCTYYRHDIGAYTLLAELLFLAVLPWLRRRADEFPMPRRLGAPPGMKTLRVADAPSPPCAGAREFSEQAHAKQPAIHVGNDGLRAEARVLNLLQPTTGFVLYSLGFLAVLSPGLAFLAVAVLPSDSWYAFVVYPLRVFREYSFLPYPSPVDTISSFSREGTSLYRVGETLSSDLGYYAPFLVYGAGLLTMLVSAYRGRGVPPCGAPRLRRDAAAKGQPRSLFLLTALGVAYVPQSLNRADEVHLLPSLLIGSLVLTSLVWGLARRSRVAVLGITGLVAVALAPAYLIRPVQIQGEIVRTVLSPCPSMSDIGRDGCTPVFPDQLRAVQFVQARTMPSDPLFVGNGRHDRIFANDTLFYFWSGRRNATRYDDLRSGRAATEPVQREIIAALAAKGVQHIVLFSGYDEVVEPNASGETSGVTLLDDFIRRDYQQIQVFGWHSIWEKR